MPGLDGLAIDLRSLATRLGSAGARRLTEAAAAAGKKAAVAALKADLPSQRLRNMGKKGAKLGVGYDLLTDTTAEIKLRPRGAWVLLDKGARPHTVGARKRRKGRGRRTMVIAGNVFTGPTSRPSSSPARNTLTDAVEGIAKAVPIAIADELAQVLDGGG